MLKIATRTAVCTLLGAVLISSAAAQAPLGDTFTYQCKLESSGVPVNDTALFRFTLWNAESGGSQVGPNIMAESDVVDGLFTTTLDFGPGMFNGAARWIEVEVQSPPGSGFVTLTPRQRVRPTPYAQTAGTALNAWALGGNLGTNPSQHFLGTNDPQSLEFRVNNEPALRLEYGSASLFGAVVGGNLVGGSPFNNVVSGQGNTIGGGGGSTRAHTIYGSVGVIAGGLGNQIGTDTDDADYATISGGFLNFAEATGATVSGGGGNSAGAAQAVVAGGTQNEAMGDYAAIGGGTENLATGRYATIPGGANNVADGDFSLAGGFFAEALHDGSFVWSDAVQPSDSSFATTGQQQFLIRARGGVGIGTNAPRSELDVAGTVKAERFEGDASWLSNVPGSAAEVQPLANWGSVGGIPGGSFIGIAGGSYHNLAIRPDGSLHSWGWDPNGVIHPPTPSEGRFVTIDAGLSFSAAIRDDGALFVWGNDEDGKVSQAPTGTFTDVACGTYHAVALRSDGSLVSWGWNGYGQVSGTPQTGSYIAVAAGTGHSVALRADGTLVTWGANFDGQVANTPTGTFTAVDAGGDHATALRTDGTLVTWGDNFHGQVGQTPAGTFTAVACGYQFSLALRDDGTLVAWGDNNAGQVSNTPSGTFEAIAAGSYEGLALPTKTYRFHERIGIGRDASINTLEVEGNASKSTAGAWLANSDRRVKTKIAPVENALDTLDRVRLVSFEYTKDYQATHRGVGEGRYLNVIAQEFAEVFPDHVKSSGELLPDGSEILQVDTYPLTIYSAAAIQELRDEMQAKDAAIASLQAANADLATRLAKLEALMTKQATN